MAAFENVEFKVTPVTKYVVTRYTSGEDERGMRYASVETFTTFDSEEKALQVVEAFRNAEALDREHKAVFGS